MKNRMLPLGYTIQNGEVVINNDEARTVTRIFSEYINGSSLKMLVNALNEENVAFKENASAWNKGRIYHILTERRYFGDDRFPQIISQEVFDKANMLKDSKSVPKIVLSKEIEYIKGIAYCGRCGSHIIRNINFDKREEWLCSSGCRCRFRPTDQRMTQGVMNVIKRVNDVPELLYEHKTENLGYRKTPEIMRLQNEMIRLNEQSVPSFQVGKKLILQIANTKFLSCTEDKSVYTEYVLERIKRVAETGILDIAFLEEAVRQVKIVGKKEIAVVFKNGVEISEKEDAQNESETCDEDRSQSTIVQAHK